MTHLPDHQILEELSKALRPELNESIQHAIATHDSPGGFWIKIPESSAIDLSVEELGALVVKTSNVFSDATRFNGIMRAELDKAEGAYKKAFREALANDARNSEGREAVASQATTEEWDHYQKVLWVYNISKAASDAARVASESARKLLDKAREMHMGERRSSWGQEHTDQPASNF
jgi:hypothetical protein